MEFKIIKLRPDAVVPAYQTEQAAAMDLHAALDNPVVLGSLERAVIPTGLAISLPKGYEAQVRARSGLAAKHGIGLVNGIGTIDADYRGDIGVILVNLSKDDFTVEPGMRIAQMVITKHENITWSEVEELDATERGKGGYGSTGTS